MADDHDTDDDVPLDDEPEVPADVRDAAEQLLAHARAGQRPSRSRRTDEQRLIGVLQLLGQLNDQRLAAAGLFSSEDPEPRDDAERRDLADSERRFVIYCANQLAMIASAALEFAIELTASFDDHSTPSQARDDAVDELRVKLLSELAIHTLRPVIDPLRPRKRDIAEHLGLIVLPSAALDVADAAHELTQHSLPGQAAITTAYLAAQLISAGDEIAAAADYRHWPRTRRRVEQPIARPAAPARVDRRAATNRQLPLTEHLQFCSVASPDRCPHRADRRTDGGPWRFSVLGWVPPLHGRQPWS